MRDRSAKSLTASLWLLAALALCAHADDTGDPPSLDFLEYLGTLVETDGEWVGPQDLEEDGLLPKVVSTSQSTAKPSRVEEKMQ